MELKNKLRIPIKMKGEGGNEWRHMASRIIEGEAKNNTYNN